MAIRTGSVMERSPSTLKTLATAVTGAERPETMSRSHESSTRWIWASTPLSATVANTTVVRTSATTVTATSRPGEATSGCSGCRAAAGRFIPDMAHPARTAPGPRYS